MPAPDLGAVDELCRLALVAERLGCRIRILDATPDVRDLLVLAGVDELLLDPPRRHPDLPCPR